MLASICLFGRIGMPEHYVVVRHRAKNKRGVVDEVCDAKCIEIDIQVRQFIPRRAAAATGVQAFHLFVEDASQCHDFRGVRPDFSRFSRHFLRSFFQTVLLPD